MLQAKEYNTRKYLDWYRQTSDFHAVEYRNTLDKTTKAKFIILCLAILRLTAWAIGVLLVVAGVIEGSIFYLVSGVFLLATEPLYTALLITIPVWFLYEFVQKPYLNSYNAKTKQIFSSHPGRIIAIAGSYGKTSMKQLATQLLSSKYKVAATPGNMNTKIGIGRFARSLDGDEEILIIELGEYYPGDIKEFCEIIEPDIGIITGVNEAHLENFGSIEASRDNIFTLENFVEKTNLYINAENETCAAMVSKGNLTYDRNGCGDIKVSDISVSAEALSFTATKGKQQHDVQTKLLGSHHVGPLSAGLHLACSAFDVPLEAAIKVIGDIKPVSARLEPHYLPGGGLIINDGYNGNPDGVKAAISLLEEIDTNGKKIYITPGLIELGDKSDTIHEQIGEWLSPVVHEVALLNNSRSKHIVKGLEASNFNGEVTLFDKPELFYATLSLKLANGDVALIQNDLPDGLY